MTYDSRSLTAGDRRKIIESVRESRRAYELLSRLTGMREWTTLVEILEKQIKSRELDALYMEPSEDPTGRLRDRLIGTAEGLRLAIRLPSIVAEDLKDYKPTEVEDDGQN